MTVDLVDLAEIAKRLGVTPGTTRVWRTRKVLPDPTYKLRTGPIWDWKVIERWSIAYGYPKPSPAVNAMRAGERASASK